MCLQWFGVLWIQDGVRMLVMRVEVWEVLGFPLLPVLPLASSSWIFDDLRPKPTLRCCHSPLSSPSLSLLFHCLSLSSLYPLCFPVLFPQLPPPPCSSALNSNPPLSYTPVLPPSSLPGSLSPTSRRKHYCPTLKMISLVSQTRRNIVNLNLGHSN